VDLEFQCIVGILPQEREHPQRLVLNAILHTDFSSVKASQGQVKEGIDYAEFANFLEEEAVKGEFGLLEDLLDHLIQKSFDLHPQLEGLCLKACKPDIMDHCRVEAELEVYRT
jgi:dihydroneopterin aldolase